MESSSVPDTLTFNVDHNIHDQEEADDDDVPEVYKKDGAVTAAETNPFLGSHIHADRLRDLREAITSLNHGPNNHPGDPVARLLENATDENTLFRRSTPTSGTDETSTDVLSEGTADASSAISVAKLPACYASMRLAPVAFFYGLAAGIIGPVFVELLKMLVCRVELKYSNETCLLLADGKHRVENDNVVALTAHYSFLMNLAGNLPCVLFAVFTGSWSDHFGRKLPMLLPFCGMLLSSFILITFAYVPVHPAVVLVVPFISAIFGGWIIAAAAMYSYLGDYSTAESLAVDFAIFEGVLGLSANLGSIVGGVMYGLYGFAFPFILYAGFQIANIIYIAIVIRDRRVLVRQFQRSHLKTLFTTKNLKENKDMLMKERLGSTRKHIFLLLLVAIVAAMVVSGTGNIQQLFFENAPLNWTVKHYTLFSSMTGIITGLIMMASVPLLKNVLELKDTAVGVIGVTSIILSYIVLSVTFRTWLAIVSATVGALAGMAFVALRSLLSNLVDSNERGKMMSVIASLQALVPIFGSFIFTTVFSATVAWWPGFSFSLAGFIMLLSLCGFCYVDMDRRRNEYTIKGSLYAAIT